VTEQQTPQLWNSDQSLQDIRFEPRPVQSDISIVIPTLAEIFLNNAFIGSLWVVPGPDT
jgi:hypothetical protein